MLEMERRLTERITAEVGALRNEFRTEMDELRGEMGAMERRLTYQIGDAAARTANAVVERFTDLFRASTDQLSAIADRVGVVERRVDDHVTDRSVHTRPRRARR